MDITHRSNNGYTFWISQVLNTSSEYDQFVAKIEREEYRLSQSGTFIIVDERSRDSLSPSDVQEIHVGMIHRSDSAIRSIITSMGCRPILLIVGDDRSYLLSTKRALAVLITRLMGDTKCTIISEPLHIVDTLSGYNWQADLRDSDRLSEKTISTMRGIQFSKGEPITTLYRLTSYLYSCLNWEDPSLIVAGVAHISETTPTQLEDIIAQGSSCKGEDTWSIHGYMLLRVDKMHGYNLDTRGLPSILSSLGGKGYKLYSILLQSSTL